MADTHQWNVCVRTVDSQREIFKTNEESLISDTMIINTAAKTYIKYSSDKDEIPATK
jgi:hypothetical protein